MFPDDIDQSEMRDFAEKIIDDIARREGIPEHEREGLVDSVMRQWNTYDDHATLFLDERRQLSLVWTMSALGRPHVDVREKPFNWGVLIESWNIDPDDIREIVGALNRGKSAEVVTREGLPLRIHFNLSERKIDVEPLGKRNENPPEEIERYHKIAADQLAGQLGAELNPALKDDLTESVVKQWRHYGGHACIFRDGRRLLILKLTQQEGLVNVVVTKRPCKVGEFLRSLGFSEQEVPAVLMRINLGQKVAFWDKNGQRCFLENDPRRGELVVERPGGATSHARGRALPSPGMVASPPIFCPKCRAVLTPWRADQPKQTCAICGEAVARG